MSTPLLYHAWGVDGYLYVRTELVDEAVHFHVRKAEASPSCARCGCMAVSREGTRQVLVQTVPVGLTPVFLVLHLRMLRCRACHAVAQESREITEPRKRYTRPFAQYVLQLAEHMTLSAIANLLEVGWDLVKEIVASDLRQRAAARSWSAVKRIAIDEIAVKKGHHYLTVIVDLDTGEALYTAPGHDHTSLEGFFVRLAAEGAVLEAIAVDMGTGYLLLPDTDHPVAA